MEGAGAGWEKACKLCDLVDGSPVRGGAWEVFWRGLVVEVDEVEEGGLSVCM